MRSVTSSTSSSVSAALLLALAGLACAGARPVAPPAPVPDRPVVLFPPLNLSGATVPIRELQEGMESALAERGVRFADASQTDAFLARHRVRYTGGLDADTARLAGEELDAAGVLVTTIELYGASVPPRVAIAMRLVSADQTARIRWIDEVARSGDDNPGLLELGVVRDVRVLQADVLSRLAGSLAAFLRGAGPAARACPGGGRFGPKELFRSPRLDAGRVYSVAVLPFVNETERRNAGELLALQFARQLEASGRFHAVEPGVLREDLLRFRMVMEGGVSLDGARVILDLVRADLVVAGYVREYEGGDRSPPRLQFTAMLLEKKNDEVVWEATSYSQGDDGVFFFDIGLVDTAPALSCRMVRSAVDEMLRSSDAPSIRFPPRPPPAAAPPPAGAPPPPAAPRATP